MNINKSILAIGSIAFDTLETPKGSRQDLLGGSATYFSIAASILAKVNLVGVVGKDFPDNGWEIFNSRSINIDNVTILDGKTFRWGGRYNHDYSERQTLFTNLGVFENFFPSINNENLTSPLVFLGNIDPELQLHVAKSVVKPEYIVCDTMNLWIDLSPKKLKDVLGLSNILLINDEEAEQFTQESNLNKAAKILLSLGPQVVVIKKGSKGSFLAYNNNTYDIPVFPINSLIDPTGAGDSFAGGFLGYIANTKNPNFIDATIVGTAVASFCVEEFGLDSLLKVTPRLLSSRVKKIKSIISQYNIKKLKI